jgi:glycerate dehydrogenase
MKIAVMESVNFNDSQKARLSQIGEIDYYTGLEQSDANRIAPSYDIVVVDFVNPTPFLLEMKPGSLVALLSTGYGWISNLSTAHEKGVLVSNIPAYATEAVAEHLLGLLLGMTKRIFAQENLNINSSPSGFELKNKTVGIIGLGNIGLRFAEIINFFGGKVITYNRTEKNVASIDDVSLEELLSKSDIICLTPSVNNSSKSLINMQNVSLIKDNAVLIGSTWGIVTEDAIVELIESKGILAAFDAAFEGGEGISIEYQSKFKQFASDKRLVLTPHIAYDTVEADIRRLDTCVANIQSFVEGSPNNIINDK